MSQMVGAMGAMMERIGAGGVHHVSPQPPEGERDLVERVYAQMRRDFFVASPFMLHASVPELLAGAWSVIRETLMCGEVDRGKKEVVAWAVSSANQCPFCVGAHHAAVRAAGASDPALKSWAEATARATSPALRRPPFTVHAAEYIGTVVAFHYLNRMVSVFLDDKMMPTPDFMDGATNAMARFMMGGMISKGRRNRPGDAIALLPPADDGLAWRPSWATSKPHVAAALAGWSSIAERQARDHLPGELIEVVGGAIEGWSGGAPGPDGFASLRSGLADVQAPVADLALATAMAPYRVDATMVEAALNAGLAEAPLLSTVAWAAARAARRVGAWTADAAPNPNA